MWKVGRKNGDFVSLIVRTILCCKAVVFNLILNP
jgi:hypothetical protein